MRLHQITAVLLHTIGTLLTLSRAVPTPAAHPPLSPCATEYPTIIRWLEKANPDSPGTNGSVLSVHKDTYFPRPNGLQIDSLLLFRNIPHNAWGCQLEFFYPAGEWSVISAGDGPQRINVYGVTDPVVSNVTGTTSNVTWNTAPQPTYLVASPLLETDEVVKEDTKIVIGSVACEPTLDFRISIPPEVEYGRLYGFPIGDPAYGTPLVRITHMVYDASGGPAELMVGSC